MLLFDVIHSSYTFNSKLTIFIMLTSMINNLCNRIFKTTVQSRPHIFIHTTSKF